MEQTLKVLKLFEDVRLPEKQNPTDSGFDLYAYSFKQYFQNFNSNLEREMIGQLLGDQVRDKTIELAHFDRILIGTGLKATVGEGYEIQIRPRSGLALKHGLTILNTPGTIDCDYRDEIGIVLINLSRQVQPVKLGERIAQLVVVPVALPKIEVVTSLPETARKGGFGSTGMTAPGQMDEATREKFRANPPLA